MAMNEGDKRAARLAAALRDNLKRRKAQARAVAEGTAEAGAPADAAPPAPVTPASDAP
jgi:predicted transcriptional regulator